VLIFHENSSLVFFVIYQSRTKILRKLPGIFTGSLAADFKIQFF